MSDYTLGETFYFAFTTRAFATGIPTTLAGTPVVSAYEDAGLTQITAGITLGVDHDSVGGLNMLTIVATGANGFEAGKDYNLVITTGTVATVSVVGEVVGRFTLGRSAAAVDLANGTDGLGAIKAETANIIADTADMQPKLGTPAGASISDDIGTVDTVVDAVKAKTDSLTFTVANQVDANMLAVSGDAGAADNMETMFEGTGALVFGACEGTPTTTSIQTDLAEATDDHYNTRIVIFTSGNAAGQATDITDYTGATGTLTVTALTTAPAVSDTFVIV